MFFPKNYIFVAKRTLCKPIKTMKTQNLQNHKRIHPLYHYFMIPISLLTIGLAVYLTFVKESFIEGIFYLLISCLLGLNILLTRIYPLSSQNRLIRAEMRVRYYELTGKFFSEVESQLSLSQIIALRFAGDEELESLIEKT